MNYKNYINNQWQDSKNGSAFTVENPFREEIVADVPNSSPTDLDNTVSPARSAWKKLKFLGPFDLRRQ